MFYVHKRIVFEVKKIKWFILRLRTWPFARLALWNFIQRRTQGVIDQGFSPFVKNSFISWLVKAIASCLVIFTIWLIFLKIQIVRNWLELILKFDDVSWSQRYFQNHTTLAEILVADLTAHDLLSEFNEPLASLAEKVGAHDHFPVGFFKQMVWWAILSFYLTGLWCIWFTWEARFWFNFRDVYSKYRLFRGILRIVWSLGLEGLLLGHLEAWVGLFWSGWTLGGDKIIEVIFNRIELSLDLNFLFWRV